jgi:phosphatidylglycerol:prolipoprotein diacylglycerol transferase
MARMFPHPFVHRIDPILFTVGGIHFWWYGLSYTIGFLFLYRHLQRARTRLGLTGSEACSLSLYIAVGVLVGGRVVEVAFDEWPFYSEHPQLIPAFWLGGMATHGLLLGAACGLVLFAWVHRRPILELADDLVIPGAFLMGMGRIGNFIDGQIVGAVTTVWWGVQFPDAEGVRHPVVLYDGVKNLLLMPFLVHVRRTILTPGATAARFVFWYPFLRIFIDLFRDYPTHRFALGTGQTLNIVMALVGLALLMRSRARRLGRVGPRSARGVGTKASIDAPASAWQRGVFAVLLTFCLAIPSNWTQDVPGRYGMRHAGLEHTWLYPRIDTRARPR